VANFADESARHIVAQIINGYNDSFPALAPVAGFAPGPMGFYDMAGNAAEWCHDFYTANPGLSRQQSPDPLGPESGTHHLVRGSSWRDGGITELRFSYRRYSRQATDDIGFRFARYAR
jgi:formylglycine-generating enzyme required for sulfatase activity